MKLVLLCMFSCVVFGSEECGKLETLSESPPWNVGIYIENTENLDLVCFGSIIRYNAILTAAHCFCDNLSNNVRNSTFFISTGKLGKKLLSSDKNKLIQIEKNDIIIHENYKGLLKYFEGDLAVIKLKTKIEKYEPVCVDWSLSSPIIEEGKVGKLPVWTKNQVELIDASHISYETCIGVSSEDFHIFINNDKICTKQNRNAISNIDNGGSGWIFQNSEDKRWYIRGVMSVREFVEKKSTITAVGINVNRYLNWLSNVYAKI